VLLIVDWHVAFSLLRSRMQAPVSLQYVSSFHLLFMFLLLCASYIYASTDIIFYSCVFMDFNSYSEQAVMYQI